MATAPLEILGPWLIRFLTLAQMELFTLTGLVEQLGISRKTAYLGLVRYADGFKALGPRHSGAVASSGAYR